MVAYNFSEEFVNPIMHGLKRQTLRKSLRAKVGDKIQLYTGMRTSECYKIVEDDPVCTGTAEVCLYPEGMQFDGHWQAQITADDYTKFDGFKDYADMYQWFVNKYGHVPIPLYETRWDWR